MRRRRVLAGGVAVAAVAAGGAVVAGGGEAPVRAAEPTVTRATATVERRDLVDREDLEGTLGYADQGTLAAGVAGTLTALRERGQQGHPRALAVRRRRRGRRRSCSTASCRPGATSTRA